MSNFPLPDSSGLLDNMKAFETSDAQLSMHCIPDISYSQQLPEDIIEINPPQHSPKDIMETKHSQSSSNNTMETINLQSSPHDIMKMIHHQPSLNDTTETINPQLSTHDIMETIHHQSSKHDVVETSHPQSSLEKSNLDPMQHDVMEIVHPQISSHIITRTQSAAHDIIEANNPLWNLFLDSQCSSATVFFQFHLNPQTYFHSPTPWSTRSGDLVNKVSQLLDAFRPGSYSYSPFNKKIEDVNNNPIIPVNTRNISIQNTVTVNSSFDLNRQEISVDNQHSQHANELAEASDDDNTVGHDEYKVYIETIKSNVLSTSLNKKDVQKLTDECNCKSDNVSINKCSTRDINKAKKNITSIVKILQHKDACSQLQTRKDSPTKKDLPITVGGNHSSKASSAILKFNNHTSSSSTSLLSSVQSMPHSGIGAKAKKRVSFSGNISSVNKSSVKPLNSAYPEINTNTNCRVNESPQIQESTGTDKNEADAIIEFPSVVKSEACQILQDSPKRKNVANVLNIPINLPHTQASQTYATLPNIPTSEDYLNPPNVLSRLETTNVATVAANEQSSINTSQDDIRRRLYLDLGRPRPFYRTTSTSSLDIQTNNTVTEIQHSPVKIKSKRHTVRSMQDLIKGYLVATHGLVKLHKIFRSEYTSISLPSVIKNIIFTFLCEDFEDIGVAAMSKCASYRVRCRYDNMDYIAAFATSEADKNVSNLWEEQSHWLKICDLGVVPVVAMAVDPLTENIFYIIPSIQDNLEQLMTIRHLSLNEVSSIARQALNILHHLKEKGMEYGPLRSESIYLVEGNVMLENQLMLKCRSPCLDLTLFHASSFTVNIHLLGIILALALLPSHTRPQDHHQCLELASKLNKTYHPTEEAQQSSGQNIQHFSRNNPPSEEIYQPTGEEKNKIIELVTILLTRPYKYKHINYNS